jgi:hypothetical protein
MRFGGLIIDTVVCLTLAKWETVSGQFGGYFRAIVTGFNAGLEPGGT